eukprot:6480799-Amphidinium_carterae.1
MSTRPLEDAAETSRAKMPRMSEVAMVDDNEYIMSDNILGSHAQIPRTSDVFLVYDDEYAGYILDEDTIGWDGSTTLTTCPADMYRDILTASHVPPMGRREVKAMQKELTVDAILEKEPQYVQKFLDATKKEYQSWIDWGAIRKLSASEAEAVRKDPQLRHRILQARAAYRDKAAGRVESDHLGRTVDLDQ